MTDLVYTLTETITGALDIQETAYAQTEVARAIRAASRATDSLCHRVFYPTVETRYFEWPNRDRSLPWRLWLDENDLHALTSLTSGSVAITTAQYLLEPVNSGPPYRSIELNRSTAASFGNSSTPQRDIAATGTWGNLGPITAIATLTAAITTTTATTLTATSTRDLGVGATILIDSEIMAVTGKTSVTTGTTLTGTITADMTVDLLTVSSTASYTAGETITIDSERMLILDITSGLIVRRATEGSTLAAHTSGATIYANRQWTVTRGQGGTTAATHSNAATITRYFAPSLAESYTIAHAMHMLQQEKAAYMTVSRVGPDQGAKIVTAPALDALGRDLVSALGRKARTRAV